MKKYHVINKSSEYREIKNKRNKIEKMKKIIDLGTYYNVSSEMVEFTVAEFATMSHKLL